MISFHLVLGTYLLFGLSCSANLLMPWCPLQVSSLALLLMFLKCKGSTPHVTGEHLRAFNSNSVEDLNGLVSTILCESFNESQFYHRT